MEIDAKTVHSLFSYDGETGSFHWIQTTSNRRGAGEVAGCLCKRSGYRLIGYGGRVYKASRLAWLYTHGEWPSGVIDHINGDRADDRMSNLRAATQGQNTRNRGKQKNNSSGFKGVHWHPEAQKWRARIKSDGRHYSLGLFPTAEEAHRAYANAAERLHGDFARAK